MATKVLLFILLSGSDSNLAASRFRHIGWSGDEVPLGWGFAWIIGSIANGAMPGCQGIRIRAINKTKTNRL